MTEPTERQYGALLVEDERDRNYPLASLHAVLGVDKLALPRKVDWEPGPQLDQGPTPACVGYAAEGLLQASPFRQSLLDGNRLYQLAHNRDGIAGPHDGTTVRAVLQVLQQYRRVSNYYWTSSFDEVLSQLAHVGPLLIAVPILQSMLETSPEGWWRVDLDSGLLGGHALLVTGYEDRWLRIRNSWGTGFGADPAGSCWLFEDELKKLQANFYVELVAVQERRP